MLFLIQENLFKEDHYNMLIELMERYKFNYKIVNTNQLEDNGINIDINTKNVFCFGSIKMAHVATKNNWYPASFMNDNHDYEIYSKGFGLENMLNGDSIICNFSDKINFDTDKFIRPCKDTKVFTGKVYNKYDWEDFVEDQLHNNNRKHLNSDTKIQVSTPKLIQQEIRCWVVKGKVITTSYYKLGSIMYMGECLDELVLNFAQEMVNKYQPADSFVIDICLVDNKPYIVEINCINCSGFYRQDLSKLINALLVYDIEK